MNFKPLPPEIHGSGDHRVVVWARGPKGVPVVCSCGYRDHALTIMGAYRLKREHLAAARS